MATYAHAVYSDKVRGTAGSETCVGDSVEYGCGAVDSLEVGDVGVVNEERVCDGKCIFCDFPT